MNLQTALNHWFRASSVFEMQSGIENTEFIQLTNDYLESFKKRGIDIHYEVHYTEWNEKNCVRLDCHAFPYWEFAGAKTNEKYRECLKQFYSEEKAEEILNFRKKLINAYRSYEKLAQLKYNTAGDNYLWLVQMPLPQTCSEEKLMAEITRFISLTYEKLVKTLNSI